MCEEQGSNKKPREGDKKKLRSKYKQEHEALVTVADATFCVISMSLE